MTKTPTNECLDFKMKKKLLITLGCSYTEGVGCYDYSSMSDLTTYFDLPEDESLYQQERFHELGWPNRVGKKLGYDKVLNLGLGGSSHSTHVKMFVEKILPMDLSNWEVLVIWMMTEPTRFSFYNDGVNRDYLPSAPNGTSIETAYLKDIKNPLFDSLHEQSFYMKVMEQICGNNDYNLLFTSWNDSVKYLFKVYKTNKFIHIPYEEITPPSEHNTNIYTSRVCSHPNENGYEWMSNKIIEGIKQNHSHYIGTPKDDIEWEWNGDPIQYPTL